MGILDIPAAASRFNRSGLASARPAASPALAGVTWRYTDVSSTVYSGRVDQCDGTQWVTIVPASGTYAALSPVGLEQLRAQKWNALQPWFNALGQRNTARANVVVLGDSWTAGQGAGAYSKRYVTMLGQILRQRLGLPAGGSGFLGQNTGVTGFTWPSSRSGSANGTQFGPVRNHFLLNTVGETLTFNVTGDSADLLYVKFGGGGTFSWAVDGGSATNVSTNAGTGTLDGFTSHISLGTAGAHTITITLVSGGCYFDGVAVFNGDYASGVAVHDAGHGGYNTNQWLAASATVSDWPAAISALNPHVLVIELGVNDLTNGISAATYQTNLQSLITLLRSVISPIPLTHVPVVLLGLPAASGRTATWPPYLAAAYAVAAADPTVTVCDTSLRVPAYDAAAASYLSTWADTLHPSANGHGMIADALAGFLLPL